MTWDEWRGSMDGRPAMWIKRLVRVFGCCVDLHKFVRADDAECFHSHNAYCLRIILWGGYVEEVEGRGLRAWRPGMVGIIKPSFSHRLHGLLKGPSYSLWLRGPICAEIELRGSGWPA